ncbi:3-oxoacyl-[acyl-carrier protein] reductase [Noviherbaspirillum humi]|uniref:3-oxoacyl-[acyl-carrier protein] reductase n=1 Tax=Noviherbaspirillum humi TaxID=1688639 RepID=A0A239LVF0_9BURK|nr:SDR family oxidoreductase [Noviherbaspirillum humi]SNT34441.1 3-oxoacyl-[acyl-carrier protein] reductase [Noviherbaspirillum humi]
MNTSKKVALVTGSATGIGRAIALAFARAGYDLAINYSRSEKDIRVTEQLAREAGAQVAVIKCDVSQEAEVEQMMKAVEEAYGGRLDVLLNNAGTTIDTPPKEFDTVKVEDFDRVFAVNVRGTFLVTKHATRLLRAMPSADIINTASIVGLRPGPQPLPYSASKAAIISMTRTLAGALGPKVRVNAIAPGWMEGDWMERALGDNYERLMDRRAKATPMQRCATAEDVAETALAIATSMRFVNGQVIVIDGGYSSIT